MSYEGVHIYRASGSVYYKNTSSTAWFVRKGYTIAIDDDVYEGTVEYFVMDKKMASYKLTTALKYVRTNISKPVDKAVTNLSYKRNSGYNFTLSWKNPKSLTDAENNRRAERFRITIDVISFDASSGKYKTAASKSYTEYSMITSWSKNLFGTSTSESSANYVWERTEFAPYTNIEVSAIQFTVQPRNRFGAYEQPTTTSAEMLPDDTRKSVKYYFELPEYPVFTSPKIDESGNVSINASSPINTSTERDCIRNRTIVIVYDTRTGMKQLPWETRTGSSFTLTYQIPDRHTITDNDACIIVLLVSPQGFKTPIGTSYNGAYYFDIYIPKKPIISIKSVSDDWATGSALISTTAPTVTSYVYSNFSVDYSPSNIKLQVLRSSSYQNASEIPLNAPWVDVGPVEGPDCNVISLPISSILPYAGTVTWIRAKSWRYIESLYYRYSEPIRMTQLETPAPVLPSPDDDMAEVLSHVVNVDGTSAELLIGWDLTGDDDSDKTEISWDTSEKAWRSNKPPTTFTIDDVDWDEGPVTIGSNTYQKSTHVTISGLEQNAKYYFSCRRILTVDKGNLSYGPYSTKYIVNTNDVSALPQSLVAYVNDSIVAGEPMQVSWGYNSPMEQSNWTIKKAVNGSEYSDNDIVLASESDNRRSYKLPYYRDAENKYAIASDDDAELYLYVMVMVSSVTLTSEIVRTRILKRPQFDIVAPSSTIVQPASLTVFSDSKGTTVSAFVEAKGIIGSGPSGNVKQSDGDTVWSGTINPQWELIDEYAEDEDVQRAKQELDDAQEAYDAVLAQYTDAMSRRDNAQSRIDMLTVSISNAQRDIPTAQATLQDAQDRLDNTDEDDPMYELYVTQVQEAQERLQELQSGLQTDTAALSVAESDLQDALDDIDAIDMSEEEEALREAIDAYATAEAEAIDPTSDTLAYKALIVLPSGLNLVDGARYIVHGFATETEFGVRSEERTTRMDIAWAHQSPDPSEDITVSAVDQMTPDGDRTIGARITLERPVNAFDTDVYDVYRITKGGVFLAASDLPLECTLLDRYATFSTEPMHYRIACRTRDGDVTWRDYPYLLQESDDTFRSAMRIDWSGNYVELERNVVPSDSYEKPFTAHTHLDGTVSGHWNEGTRRTMSVQAALVRTYDNAQREAIEELARYDGPCYVRTNDGVAFECNVQVDSINLNRNSIRIDISLTMTEIEPTGAFSAVVEE